MSWKRIVLALNVVVTVAAMGLAYRALNHADDSERLVIRSRRTLRTTIRSIRQAENDVLTARLQADANAGRWVNGLAITMTGLATALLTTLVGALVFLARPGAWRGGR